MGRETFGQIQKMRSGRFQARFQHPHQPYVNAKRNYVKAPMTFRTKTKAREWLRLQEYEIIRGVWKSEEERYEEERQQERSRELFGSYAHRWVETRRLKKSSRLVYRDLLTRWILPTFEAIPLDAITPPMIRSWLSEIAPGAPQQRARVFRLMKTICGTAVDDEVITSNPCRSRMLTTVSSPQVENKYQTHKRTALSREELYALADAVPRYLRLLVLVGGLTGLRIGELRGLRVEDVRRDHNGRVWLSVNRTITSDGKYLVEGSPKTQSSIRSVPLPTDLGAEILALCRGKSESMPLFGKRSDPSQVLTYSVCHSHIKESARKLGLGVITPHDLRHTAASLAISAGAPPTVVRDLLGHTTVSMTSHYTHSSLDDLVKAVEY